MVLHFQFDLFSNRNLRANIRIGKDTKKAQSILNRERERERERVTLWTLKWRKKTKSSSWIWGKEKGKKYIKPKKKKDTFPIFCCNKRFAIYQLFIFVLHSITTCFRTPHYLLHSITEFGTKFIAVELIGGNFANP